MFLEGGLGGGRGCVAGGSSRRGLEREPQTGGSEAEKPARQLHLRGLPLHREGRCRVSLGHQVQELDGAGSCMQGGVRGAATGRRQTRWAAGP